MVIIAEGIAFMVIFGRFVSWAGGKSSGFEALLNRSFCSWDSKSTGLIKALSKEILPGYENVLKNGCPGNECVEAEAEGGMDYHVFQACACQGGSSKKWA